jgi:hypothetical protein
MSAPKTTVDTTGPIAPTPLIEDWTDYQTSDGSRIRAKLVVFKFLGVPEMSQPAEIGLNVVAILQVAVTSPAGLVGRKEMLSPPEIAVAPKTPIRLRPTSEPWNYYSLPGQSEDRRFVKIRLTIVSAQRITDHFDNEGNPLYAIQTAITGGPASREESEETWAALVDRDRPIE